ncbi:hypothetical protein Pla52o_38110 [Novipirellula galeiformis]|uniref:Uncharacterized protein n=1 Tax=Novipirellula galeiformis TaxID=2528004 RepID=A0A5C6CDQ9_9BACT|nr:hypothetical protein Pla52o_38110 [Novipirellula galeiformis]
MRSLRRSPNQRWGKNHPHRTKDHLPGIEPYAPESIRRQSPSVVVNQTVTLVLTRRSHPQFAHLPAPSNQPPCGNTKSPPRKAK